MRRTFFLFVTLFMMLSAFAADPTATAYSYEDCEGSLRPYPDDVERVAAPDSLLPVHLNHVGRHGARFPSSSRNTFELQAALLRADSLGTITPEGRRLLALTRLVADRSHNYWGALDSLGEAEQRGIASRMLITFPQLFMGGTVDAISSYSPRCVMSMYQFTHQLDRLNNDVEIYTSAGRQNSPLMRPFDLSKPYADYIRSKVWETPYEDYMAQMIDAAPLKRVLGNGFPLTQKETERLVMAEYYFIAGLAAMSIEIDPKPYFTLEEMNRLWSVFNLRQYLQRTANVLSAEPADIASKLVIDLVETTDLAAKGKAEATVNLRFGHAETLLPLYSLLRLKGAYYLTNYFDTVASHFRDFELVPMGGNLQMILFRTAKGRHYMRFDLNEQPITLMPNDDRIYLPWEEAKEYMLRCLPLIDQP